MNEKELYSFREQPFSGFNYWFDRITQFFIWGKKPKINNFKKVLFIRNDHIGDMVYSTQSFRELKKAFPNVEITVIATPSNRQIIDKDPNVDRILEVDQFWRRGFGGFKDYYEILKILRKEKFDLGIDLRKSKLNIFFFLWVPGIKIRSSFYNLNGGKAFLTHPITYDKIMDFNIENIYLFNKLFNLDIKNYWPEIQTDEEDETDVLNMFKEKGLEKKNYVVFGPGATEDTKRWPESKFNELIKIFHEKYPNHKVVLSGAGGDSELIEGLSNKRDYCVPLINFNLRKMALVFKYSNAVVANDGCGTDISWVAGGKLVTLVGPVDHRIHKPLKNGIILHHQLPCHPCDWTKPCKRPYKKWCMDMISVDEVFNAVEKQMKS
jgi:ADP-heptose:LPS heptosyltransferase